MKILSKEVIAHKKRTIHNVKSFPNFSFFYSKDAYLNAQLCFRFFILSRNLYVSDF